MTEEKRIKLLEKALLAYVERYGILEGAREYFVQTGMGAITERNARMN